MMPFKLFLSYLLRLLLDMSANVEHVYNVASEKPTARAFRFLLFKTSMVVFRLIAMERKSFNFVY